MESIQNSSKRLSLSEDRGGFPDDNPGESNMQPGGDELCNGQADFTGTPKGASVQPENNFACACTLFETTF